MAKTEVPKKAKPIVQYFHDGQPISEYQNKISSIAWWYTKGCRGTVTDSKGHEHLPSKAFRRLLARLGVTDPKGEFDVTLPNGIRISAQVVDELIPVPPRVKKADRPEAVAARAVSKGRATLATQAKAETAAVAEWKRKGSKGPKPSTPAKDRLMGTTATRRATATKQAAKKTSGAKKTSSRAAAKSTANARVRKSAPSSVRRTAPARTRGAA